jgi:spore maturation protein CgeB
MRFADVRQLINQLKRLSRSPDEAQSFATAGRERAQQRHTYAHRLQKLADWIGGD